MSNIFKKNKLISLLLVFVLTFGMLFSTAIPAYATDINKSNGNGKSKVVTTVTPAKFNVTVPYVLPISIDAEQNVYTADNVAISNNSNGPIKVSDATLTTNEGWELVADGTDFSSVPVNSKQFTMRVLDAPVLTSGSIDTDSFGTINGNSSLNMNYSADAAVQGEEVSATNIANVLFTIEWDNVEITSATVSKTALQSFAKTVTTFQKTSERLNIDDVKSIEGLKKIDDGSTDKSIYVWSDADGNGYWWTNAMIAYLPTNCSRLFASNWKIEALDLSQFNTSKVTDMYSMFSSCEKLATLDVSSFDTSNVTDMRYMFYTCYKLTSLDLSSFDTSNVKTMGYMFYECTGLKSLDISSFNTSNVTDMHSMFDSLPIASLDLTNFDTHNVLDMGYMFYNSKIVTLNLSSFNTNNAKNMSGMFSKCTVLTSLIISGFNTSNVTNMSMMFYNCSRLTSLDLSHFNTSNVTDMSGMFTLCSNLTSLDLSNFDTRNVKSLNALFKDCSKLTSLDLSNFNTSEVSDMIAMFDNCSNLTSLNISNFDTSKVQSMSWMFYQCKKLTSLDLSSFNTSNVTNMSNMFNNCLNLKTIYVSDFDVNTADKNSNMFLNCSNLVGQNGTTYNSSYVDKAYARIDTADTPGYFTYKAKSA